MEHLPKAKREQKALLCPATPCLPPSLTVQKQQFCVRIKHVCLCTFGQWNYRIQLNTSLICENRSTSTLMSSPPSHLFQQTSLSEPSINFPEGILLLKNNEIFEVWQIKPVLKKQVTKSGVTTYLSKPNNSNTVNFFP